MANLYIRLHEKMHIICYIKPAQLAKKIFLISAHKAESMHFNFAFKCTLHAALMSKFCYTFFQTNSYG